MSNPRKISQSTRLTPLLTEYAAIEGRVNYLETRKEEIRDLIRARVRRSLGCIGYGGKTTVGDVALELAEDFPQVREIMGFKSFKQAAEWVLEGAL